MEEEEPSYRVESPEKQTEEEVKKKGLFKPLPSAHKRVTTAKRAEPIVTFFGFHMRERNRDLLLLILTPTLAAIIDAGIIINSFTAVGQEVNAGALLVVCMVIALLVGLTQTSSGRALISGIINTLLYLILNIAFIASPAIYAPDLTPVNEFYLAAVIVTLPQIVIILPGCIIGVFFGHILREVF